jgi:predicted transcriptional regulator
MFISMYRAAFVQYRVMTMKEKIESYFDQLKTAADEAGVSLLRAFIRGGSADGTYYRTLNGTTELRIETAQKVFDAIRILHAEGAPQADTPQADAA